MDQYDIRKAFEVIERELMVSMIRNLDRHKAEETSMGIEWSQWQVEQLKRLEQYKIRNQKKYKSQFADINRQIDVLIRTARESGGMDQEIEILKAIKNGFKGYKRSGDAMTAQFFRTNDRKLEALIKATTDDMKKAETAILRMANDKYRQVIFNAQVYANTGAGTYQKAIDMATKDMLSAGLNCVEYANGARHTLADYADMAIRTACKRAYLTGEGEKRKEWGISTVIMNKRGNPCPKCLPWVGKIMIDDVWSGGKPSDGKYPLMSTAVAAGLYHPRCRDSHTTYFDGISPPPDSRFTQREIRDIEQENKEAVERQYAERQQGKYQRLAENSLDEENQKKYHAVADSWKKEKDKSERKLDILQEYSNFIKRIRSVGTASRHKDRMAMFAEFAELIEDNRLPVSFAYVLGEDVIKYNLKSPNINKYNLEYVFAHEISHRMDILEYQSWKNKKFLSAIDICSQKVYDNKESVMEWFSPGAAYAESFALSDIISALTEGDMSGRVGHDKKYWQVHEHKALEVFANISSIDVLGLPESHEFSGILKELFDAYKEMVN